MKIFMGHSFLFYAHSRPRSRCEAYRAEAKMAYMNDPPLTGRAVALPEARELQVVAALLERRVARVLRG
jgi:hypothetical protein